MDWRGSRVGMGRPRARISFPSRSTPCWWRRSRARIPRLDRLRRLAIILHDAPEYVIGDMISPFKVVIGDSYKAVEKRLLAAIHLRFGLPPVLPEEIETIVKTADHGAAYFEATRLAGFDPAEARRFFGKPPTFSLALERDYLNPWPAEVAEGRYRERLAKLAREEHAP